MFNLNTSEMRKLTQEEFVERANKVHNGKYDYSKVVYVNAHTKVCIICPIHGEFWQAPFTHLVGSGCVYCGKNESVKKQSKGKEQFIKESQKKHNKYNYSKVEYINSYTPVIIICPEHGEFLQKPYSHLSGSGCPKCGEIKKSLSRRSYNRSVGIVMTDKFICNEHSYSVWKDMMRRCYNRGNNKKWKSYEDCTVCDEWFCYDSFAEWFDKHYIEGWHLDKDILVKGNRCYSPDTCCFVPKNINNYFRKTIKKSGLPVGVKCVKNKFYVELQFNKKRYYFGSFKNAEEAHKTFERKKKELIAQEAIKYKSQLEDRVFIILTNLESQNE